VSINYVDQSQRANHYTPRRGVPVTSPVAAAAELEVRCRKHGRWLQDVLYTSESNHHGQGRI